MERRKLLVADASVCCCEALVEALHGTFDVRMCHDGNQALSVLDSFCPDVMVVDLTLPGLDGLTLLRMAAQRRNRPALLATTRFYSEYIERVIGQIGVDYVMVKPFHFPALAERVTELGQCDSCVEPVSLDETRGMLLELGVRPSRKGFGYLEELIDLYRQNPGKSMTKELYPEVGKRNHTSAQAVERAVRDAVGWAWNYRDETVWRRYFSAGRSGQLYRPTNREFIAAVAMIMDKNGRIGA